MFDFEFVPRATGDYVLATVNFVGANAAGTPTIVPMHVRELTESEHR